MSDTPTPQLANPPREVPWLLRMSILCGGFFNQFGWGWTGFALIFVWVFVPILSSPGLTDFGGKLEVAEGVVLSCEKTGFGDDADPVYSYQYEFKGPDGVERTGMSFAPGRHTQAGGSVLVEFAAETPDISRIQGMDLAPFSGGGWMEVVLPMVFLMLFPAIGIVFLVIGLRRGVRANRLLATGAGAMARKVSEVATNTRINNKTVYKYTFEFAGGDGQLHQAVARTHLTERFAGREEQFVLYAREQPSLAMVFSDLPPEVRIDERGQVHAAQPRVAAKLLILPAAVLTLHGIIAYFVFVY